MTKRDEIIRRFLCSWCEKNTYAARCKEADFRVIFHDTFDFGWRAIVINDRIPGLFFNLEHDDAEQETRLTTYRREDEFNFQDEEEGLTF